MAVALDTFLEEWRKSAAHERSNFQSFIRELCDLICVQSLHKASKRDRVSDVLASLVAMGRAHKLEGDTYASETAIIAA